MKRAATGSAHQSPTTAFKTRPMKLEPLGFHEARHTLVSLMHAAGNSLEEIGDFVGHSSTYMLLDGPRLVERFYAFLPESARPRWQRVGHEIYRTVGGYVTGNVVISVIAGVAAAIVLFALGSKYSVALAVVVAILDLVPLAGATMAAVIVSAVVFVELGWVKGVIIIVFFLLYQQLENHVLQPVIYGRTVQLSPLVVLISVLIGAELAGILGALAAIPVAGMVQAVGREFLRYRAETASAPP